MTLIESTFQSRGVDEFVVDLDFIQIQMGLKEPDEDYKDIWGVNPLMAYPPVSNPFEDPIYPDIPIASRSNPPKVSKAAKARAKRKQEKKSRKINWRKKK